MVIGSGPCEGELFTNFRYIANYYLCSLAAVDFNFIYHLAREAVRQWSPPKRNFEFGIWNCQDALSLSSQIAQLQCRLHILSDLLYILP